jgi:DNA-binding transcriptional LysR family regulator
MARLDWYIRANLKLRHLQLLVALDDMRHVGRVAGYLNVSQPAISKTLAQLEADLQVTLFERNTKGLEPTAHGECFIRHAREILLVLSQARDEMADLSQGRLARLTLGVLPSSAVLLVPRFIVRLEAASAAVAVAVREGTMDTLLPQLRAGDVHYVVGALPKTALGIEFESDILYEDPLVVVVRRGHPLTRARTIDWPMLADYPMVLPPAGTTTRGPIEALFAAHDTELPRRHLDSVSTMTNVGVLQDTDSVGFLSQELARHFAALGMASILPLDLAGAVLRVALIWKTERRANETHATVRRLFRETCEELPALVR